MPITTREHAAVETKKQPQVQEALVYLEKEICRLKEFPQIFSNRLQSVLPEICTGVLNSSPERDTNEVELATRIRTFTNTISEVLQDFQDILNSLEL